MKLKNKLKMFEEFTSAEKNTKTTIDSKGAVKTSSNRTTAILDDVDGILNNLEALSKQIDEGQLFEAEGGLDALFKKLNSMMAIAQCRGKWREYEKLMQEANADLIEVLTYEKGKKIAEAIEALENKAESADADQKIKIKKKIAQAKEQKAELKAMIDSDTVKKQQKLDQFKTELGQDEQEIIKDNGVGQIYFNEKKQLEDKVTLEGKTSKAKMEQEKGNKEAAQKLAEEIQKIEKAAKETAKKIADGEAESEEDIKELRGAAPYQQEIVAIIRNNKQVKVIQKEAKAAAEKLIATPNESLELNSLQSINENLATLISKAKGKANKKALQDAIDLGKKLKTAREKELELKKALADKIKGKEVPKSIIQIAGGDPEAAEEKENGFVLKTFIQKFGGGTDMPSPEEFDSVKSVNKQIEDAQDAIAQIDGGSPPPSPADGGDDQLTDDQKRRIREEETVRDERQRDLDAEKAKPESEQNQQRIQGLEAGIAQNNADIEAIRNEEPPAESVSVPNFNQSITESYAFKSGSIADRFKRLL